MLDRVRPAAYVRAGRGDAALAWQREAVAAERALAEPDPWAGFTGFVRRICVMQAGDRGLADLLLITLAPSEQLEAIREQANRNLITLIDRAKAAGRLRTDMVGEDLLLMLIGNTAIAAAAREDAPQALPRFVALMLDALQPQPGASLPRPPTTAQMRRVMSRLAAGHGCGPPPGNCMQYCGYCSLPGGGSGHAGPRAPGCLRPRRPR